MTARLIINADDCNLTAGVTGAILDAHDNGIVSSTTFLVNLPVETPTVRQLKRRRHLGVGLHLNITLGSPVSRGSRLSSLICGKGQFLKRNDLLLRKPKPSHIAAEYEAQIRLFRRHFGRLPTHLDTHHQLHDDVFFWRVLLQAARRFRLPVRRSTLVALGGAMPHRVASSDYLFGDLNPEGYWRKRQLIALLEALPEEGISEVMCHPGKIDKDLRKISSFTTGREKEWRLFRQPSLRRKLKILRIDLAHFGMCYT